MVVEERIKTIDPYHNITKMELDQIGIFLGCEVSLFVDYKGKENEERGTVRFVGE